MGITKHPSPKTIPLDKVSQKVASSGITANLEDTLNFLHKVWRLPRSHIFISIRSILSVLLGMSQAWPHGTSFARTGKGSNDYSSRHPQGTHIHIAESHNRWERPDTTRKKVLFAFWSSTGPFWLGGTALKNKSHCLEETLLYWCFRPMTMTLTSALK